MLRSERFIFAILPIFLFGLTTQARSAEPLPEYLKKFKDAYFKDADPKVPACVVADRGPGISVEKVDLKLDQFLEAILSNLRHEEHQKFREMFHPRAKAPHDIGEKIFANIKNTYEKPWQFSVFRLWALYDAEASKEHIPCPGDEGVTLTTRYGYPLQFGLWLQVMGQNELGRIFVAVVPDRTGAWKIGGWHFQQWTHQGKDSSQLVQEALAAENNKDIITAYVKLDVAQKMLFGGEFLTYPVKEEILKHRASLLKSEDWLERVKNVSKNPEVVYAGTALGKDGIGYLLRQRVPGELTVEDLRKKCDYLASNLREAKWIHEQTGGLKCEFLMPGETLEREGKLGGFYLTRQDILVAKTAKK